jgi:hypothetical protein
MKTNMTRTLIAAGLLSALIVSGASAQRAHLGFRGGYNFDREDALVGAQFSLPVGGLVEVYPSFDYYLTDGSGSMVGINMDLKLRTGANHSAFYVGGGLNMMRASSGGSSNTNTGGNLFAGLESRLGSTHPFFEVRGLLREQSSVQLVGGLNFTIY